MIACSMRADKARRDFERLKERRFEKRVKDGIEIRESMEKASPDHVELIFLYERHMQGDFW